MQRHRTAPQAHPEVVVTAAGDYGVADATDAVLRQVSALEPDVHLALGDLSYDELAPAAAGATTRRGRWGRDSRVNCWQATALAHGLLALRMDADQLRAEFVPTSGATLHLPSPSLADRAAGRLPADRRTTARILMTHFDAAPATGNPWLQRHARRRVNDVCAMPRLESGPDVLGWRGAQRIAVLVHWSADGLVSQSVSQAVAQLAALGYLTAVCSTCEVPRPLLWPHGKPASVAVYRRPNVGIDFGTWGAMLTGFPHLRAAANVILMNDSMLGPFASIGPILEQFEAADCDVWGLVDSNQLSPHFQSHFVGYRGGVLTDSPLVHFWSNIRLQPTKETMIKRYERGLHPLLQRVGYRLEVGFPWQSVVANGRNPTVIGWRRLLDFGFPWVKRELIWKPYHLLTDADDVARVIEQRFGEDVSAWV